MSKEENFLNNLWDGNIFPQEELLNTKNEEINNSSSRLDKMHLELSEKINKELFDMLNNYELEHGRYHSLIAEEAFKVGFSLAVKMMAEIIGRE